jgi:hypothetical protein
MLSSESFESNITIALTGSWGWHEKSCHPTGHPRNRMFSASVTMCNLIITRGSTKFRSKWAFAGAKGLRTNTEKIAKTAIGEIFCLIFVDGYLA